MEVEEGEAEELTRLVHLFFDGDEEVFLWTRSQIKTKIFRNAERK